MSKYTLPFYPHCSVYKTPEGQYDYIFEDENEDKAYEMAVAFAAMCHRDLRIHDATGNNARIPFKKGKWWVVQVSPDENVSVNSKVRNVKEVTPNFSKKVLDAAEYAYRERLSKPYTNDKNPPKKLAWEVK